MNIMHKHILSIIIGIAAMLLPGLTSCNGGGATDRLEKIVAGANDQCPMPLGSVGVMESARYNEADNAVEFRYGVSEDVVSIPSLRNAGDARKAFMASYLRSEDGRGLLDEMVAADASLALVFRGLQSGDSAVVALTRDELREIQADREADDSALAQLSKIAGLSNAECPKEITDGLIIEGVTVDEGFMNFLYSYDPAVYSLNKADLPAIAEETCKILKEQLTAPEGRMQLKVMKECNAGMRYIYVPADSAAADTIVVDAARIAEF